MNWPYDWSETCNSEPVVFQPQTKEELQTAVDLWVDDNASALTTYGEINTWIADYGYVELIYCAASLMKTYQLGCFECDEYGIYF